jgi:hypothetical protein
LTDPQSFNRYSYTQNDPVNFTDPTGLEGLKSWFFSYKEMVTVLAGLSGALGGGGGGAREVAQVAEERSPGEGVDGDTTGDNGQPVYGHLGSRAMHLYGTNDGRVPAGSGITGVYLPPGYTALYANPQTLPEYRGGSFVAFYPNLNGLRSVSIIVTHVANFTGSSSDRNAAGSVYIGNIGGRGAAPSDNPNYIHAHFELVRGRVVRGRSTTRMPHISFADAFCR